MVHRGGMLSMADGGVYASRVRTRVYAHMRKLRIFRPLDHRSL